MLDRRSMLFATVAAAAAPGLGFAQGADAAKAEGDRMRALFMAFVNEYLDRSPELATNVGFDSGPRAAQRSQLDDRSLAALARFKAADSVDLGKLHALNRAILTPADKVSYDVVDFVFSATVQGEQSFDYDGGQLQNPYVVSQLSGAYQGVPDFLDSQHPVKVKSDAEAYLSRLAAFATALDQESERIRHDSGLGCAPPDFVIDKTLIQLKALRDAPAATSNLVGSLARRAKAAGHRRRLGRARRARSIPARCSRR